MKYGSIKIKRCVLSAAIKKINKVEASHIRIQSTSLTMKITLIREYESVFSFETMLPITEGSNVDLTLQYVRENFAAIDRFLSGDEITLSFESNGMIQAKSDKGAISVRAKRTPVNTQKTATCTEFYIVPKESALEISKSLLDEEPSGIIINTGYVVYNRFYMLKRGHDSHSALCFSHKAVTATKRLDMWGKRDIYIQREKMNGRAEDRLILFDDVSKYPIPAKKSPKNQINYLEERVMERIDSALQIPITISLRSAVYQAVKTGLKVFDIKLSKSGEFHIQNFSEPVIKIYGNDRHTDIDLQFGEKIEKIEAHFRVNIRFLNAILSAISKDIDAKLFYMDNKSVITIVAGEQTGYIMPVTSA